MSHHWLAPHVLRLPTCLGVLPCTARPPRSVWYKMNFFILLILYVLIKLKKGGRINLNDNKIDFRKFENSFVQLTLGRCLPRGRRTFGCQFVKAPRCRCCWTQNKNPSLPLQVRRPSSQEEPTGTRWTKDMPNMTRTVWRMHS
jgi:hypothetical protein